MCNQNLIVEEALEAHGKDARGNNDEVNKWQKILETSATSSGFSDDENGARALAAVGGVSQCRVPLVLQNQHWDCGLACTLMTLKALGIHQWTFESLYTLCPTTSIWTIDIAHLMTRCGVEQCIYSTTCIGANMDYTALQFYGQRINEDKLRVNKLFETAEAAGIHVHEGSLSLEQLIAIVKTNNYLVIALIDKYTLLASYPGGGGGGESQQPGTAVHYHKEYTGHYILVEGFDSDSREFLIKDPALRDEALWVAADVLDAARKSYGTDEDLLFIPIS